jgi:hypothetical protein
LKVNKWVCGVPVVDEGVGGGAPVAEGEQVLVVVVGLRFNHHCRQLNILLEASRHLINQLDYKKIKKTVLNVRLFKGQGVFEIRDLE